MAIFVIVIRVVGGHWIAFLCGIAKKSEIEAQIKLPQNHAVWKFYTQHILKVGIFLCCKYWIIAHYFSFVFPFAWEYRFTIHDMQTCCFFCILFSVYHTSTILHTLVFFFSFSFWIFWIILRIFPTEWCKNSPA